MRVRELPNSEDFCPDFVRASLYFSQTDKASRKLDTTPDLVLAGSIVFFLGGGWIQKLVGTLRRRNDLEIGARSAKVSIGLYWVRYGTSPYSDYRFRDRRAAGRQGGGAAISGCRAASEVHGAAGFADDELWLHERRFDRLAFDEPDDTGHEALGAQSGILLHGCQRR